MSRFYSLPPALGPSPLEPAFRPLQASAAEQDFLRALLAAQEAFEATLTPYQREVAADLQTMGLGRFEAAVSASVACPEDVLGFPEVVVNEATAPGTVILWPPPREPETEDEHAARGR